jgi:dTDP-6-deoxy-L-talose 4-dehydrogenase (NAD+)
MKKILVTGANGYLGRYVIDALLKFNDIEVIACDITLDSVNKKASRLELNLFEQNMDTIFVKTGSPDICFHMAWKDGFAHNSDAHMKYLSSHYLFCKSIIEQGIKHLAVMGSMHEIGYYEGAIDENTQCNPLSHYGVAKNALRQSLQIMLQKRDDICFQWLRAYYIYGDDKYNHSIFTKLVQAAEEGKKKFPFTSGKNKYDFIEIDKLAKQLACCIMQDKVYGIINCCSGKPVSLAEKVEAFIKEHHLDIKLEYGAFPDRPYDSSAVWGDDTKIRRIMNENS